MALDTSFKDRVQAALRLSIPLSLMAFLLVLNMSAPSYPLSFLTKVPFFLVGVFYWSIYRPTLVPPWFMFVAGLSLDIIGALPLGLNALSFILFRWVIADQRRLLMGQPFLVIWVAFLFLSLVFLFVQSIIFSAVSAYNISFYDIGFSTLLSAALFPLVYLIFHLSHKILPAGEDGLDLKSTNPQMEISFK